MTDSACVQRWLAANPAAPGPEHLVTAQRGVQAALAATNADAGFQQLAIALDALGIWLGLRIIPTGRSFWSMDPLLRRRFPDYAWPVIATLDELRAEVAERVAALLPRDVEHAQPAEELATAHAWARTIADELCDLLEVLKDPKPAAG